MSFIKDRSSLEWIRIKDYCNDRLSALQVENEADLDEVETATIRGQIKFCREILSLEEDEPTVEVPNTDYLG